MDGDLVDARKTFSSLIVAFRKRLELPRGESNCTNVPKKGVPYLLGSNHANSSEGSYQTVLLS